MPNILDCNTRDEFCNDKADIVFFGEKDNIKSIFDNALRKSNGEKASINDADYLMVNGKKIALKHRSEFFMLLWYQYLKTHQNVVKDATNYNGFRGQLVTGLEITQGEVIEKFIKDNGKSIMTECSDFMDILKGKAPEDGLEDNEQAPEDIEKKLYELKKKAMILAKMTLKEEKDKFFLSEQCEKQEDSDFLYQLASLYYDFYENNITEMYGKLMQNGIEDKYREKHEQ